MDLGHLLQHTGTAGQAAHQVVGQQNRERLIPHQGLGAQHRVAQAQGMRLAHIRAHHVSRLYAAHHIEQGTFASGLQLGLKFVSGVEMVLNGPFAATSDKNHVADARFVGFFDGILDQRLVHHRQHFFGTGFGGGQKARAQASDGKYSFLQGLFHGGCGC